MRFKTDENLPEEFAVRRRVAHSSRLDLGFADIRSYPPGEHAGMIVLRPGQQDKSSVLAIANRLVMALRDHPIDHELWIVDDRRIRIRS